jgi:methyl-accepting chemotaxis protein
MTVSARLLSLSLIGALISLAVGLFGLTRTSQLADLLEGMYLNAAVPIANVANANMQAIYHNRSLYDYVIEEQQAEMDKIAEP